MTKIILLILFFQTAQADSLDERQQLAAAKARDARMAECTALWQKSMAQDLSILNSFIRAHRGQRAEGSCEVRPMSSWTTPNWCPPGEQMTMAASDLSSGQPVSIWSCRLYLNDGLDCIASVLNSMSARCYDASGNVTSYPKEERRRNRKSN